MSRATKIVGAMASVLNSFVYMIWIIITTKVHNDASSTTSERIISLSITLILGLSFLLTLRKISENE